MNNVSLVGRIIKELEEFKEGTMLTLGVQRPYKNIEGIYETDCIPCITNGNLKNHCLEYLQLGDIVGIKGRLQMIDDKLYVVCDKISFLSNRKEGE